MEYLRFITHSAIEFAGVQAQVRRRRLPAGAFITRNGTFKSLIYHALTARHLDFLLYDSYPNFAFCPGENPLATGSLNDRSWSRNL